MGPKRTDKNSERKIGDEKGLFKIPLFKFFQFQKERAMRMISHIQCSQTITRGQLI